jgi:hypothetical protein
MTPEQQREIRLGVLRVLLHPASGISEVLEGIPDGDLGEVIDVVTETLSARLEMLQRAKKPKGFLDE